MRKRAPQEPPGSGSRPHWRRALALAVAALLCGLLLGGLSAWFLGAVAIAGLSAATALVFNFHIPGALVRLFAVGRTVARYGERLAGHKAALTDQVARRVGVFRAMAAAPAVRGTGWQLGDQARLADYLDDVEDLDYGRLRVDLPAATLAIGAAGLAAATLAVAPLALPPVAALALATLLAGRRILASGEATLAQARKARRDGAQALGAAMAAAVPLRAEAMWDGRCDAALASFSAAERAMLGLRRRLAALDALAALAGPGAALSVIGAAWLAGTRGGDLLVPLFVAFAWFAFAETAQGASRPVLAGLKRDAAREGIEPWLAAPAAGDDDEEEIPAEARALSHPGLQPIGPDGRPLGAPLALDFRAGEPAVLVGASGAGKTSLLKQVAGWIGDDTMSLDGRTADAGLRRRLSMLCPHDAAILADTVRANLFAPDAGDAALAAALAAVELDDRIAKAGGLDGWITQETLSLGEAQRLNLARAFLSDKPVILLDEPTEHLDEAQGARILKRLLARLANRIVIVSSHRRLETDEGSGHVVPLEPASAG